MTQPPPSTPDWEAQEPVGEVSLSGRDTLVATNVRRGQTWYLRLQVHRQEVVNGVATSVPGQRGVILPTTALLPVLNLLQRSVEVLPFTPAEEPDDADDWFREELQP
jgi:hypothetical protein